MIFFSPEDSEFRDCNKCNSPYIHKKSIHDPNGICLWCTVNGDELFKKFKKDLDKVEIDRPFDI